MKKNNSKLVLIALLMMSSAITNSILAQAKKSSKSATTENFKSVKIGNQIWMAENLNVSTFRNGDPIPEFRKDINDYNNKDLPYWCYYNFSIANGNIYGKLYNWAAVNDKKGLAPKGWHIPSKEEWEELATFVGFEENRSSADGALGKLKSTSGWEGYYNGNGTNETGFNALPGGFGSNPVSGSFYLMEEKEAIVWWCAGKYYGKEYCARINSVYSGTIPFLDDTDLSQALYVRCIKDGNKLTEVNNQVKTSSKSTSSGAKIQLTKVDNSKDIARQKENEIWLANEKKARLKQIELDKKNYDKEVKRVAAEKIERDASQAKWERARNAPIKHNNKPANVISK